MGIIVAAGVCCLVVSYLCSIGEVSALQRGDTLPGVLLGSAGPHVWTTEQWGFVVKWPILAGKIPALQKEILVSVCLTSQ